MKSQNVARNPVKLARTGARKAFGEGQRTLAIKKILVPTDFSPTSEKALQYASTTFCDMNTTICCGFCRARQGTNAGVKFEQAPLQY